MQSDISLAEKYLNKAENAKKRNIEFNLSLTSYKNLQRAKKCYFTSIVLTDKVDLPNSRTIDRIDPNKGYEKGNVVACCLAANQLKARIEEDIHNLGNKAIEKLISKCQRHKVIGVKKRTLTPKTEVVKHTVTPVYDNAVKAYTPPSSKFGVMAMFSGPRENDLTGRTKGKFVTRGYLGGGFWCMKCNCGEEVKVKSADVKNTSLICCPKCGY